MNLVPYLEERDGYFLVGARNPESDYSGPVAQVYVDRDWLHVITDDYEGAAMLNRAALPKLIEALQRLAEAQTK